MTKETKAPIRHHSTDKYGRLWLAFPPEIRSKLLVIESAENQDYHIIALELIEDGGGIGERFRAAVRTLQAQDAGESPR